MTETEKNALNQELIEDIALSELTKLNPTFGGSPLTDKGKNYFLHEIRNRRWELGKGREVVPLTETGAPVSDPHGWPLSFQAVIEGITSELFDVTAKEAEPERMSEEQYISSMRAATTPEQRVKLADAWTLQQKRK